MKKKIRYALIGFGGIAQNRIAKEGFAVDPSRFAPLEDVELAGVYDLDPARKKDAEALKLRFFPSVEAAFSDPEIDAVYIATNNASHAPLAMAAMKRGKHVLLEKPAATSLAEVEKLMKYAKRHSLSLGIDHMMIHNALNVKAKKLVRSGALGEVNDFCFHMEAPFGYLPAEAKSWRCSNVREMGGPVGDVASHCFYMAEFLFDSRVVEVCAVYFPKRMDIAAEDGAYLKITLANGISGSIRVAFCEKRGGVNVALGNLGYELYGSQAALRGYGVMFQFSGLPDESYPIHLELDRVTRRSILRPPKNPPVIYRAVIEAHANSIRQNKPMDGSDAFRNLQLCLAAHRSAASGGKAVTISA